MPSRSRSISVLGVLFVVIGATEAILTVATGGQPLEAALDFAVISLPGLLFLSVGRWLSSTELDPELYPRIVLWCLGGIGVMFVFLVLRAIHPGVAASFSFGTRAIALAIGSIAGLAIGVHEARAITREREVVRRNDELKRTQERLERRNEELRRIRTDLERTVDELEASNERLDHFASTAAHDLQEPLRMISSYLRLVERRYAADLDDDGREFVAYAVDGAGRLQTTVDGLLTYSRVETQGDPFEPVDLEAVLEDVLTDLQLRVDEHDAEITVDDLPRVRGDRAQLRQLFQNLVHNAIEYSDGSPRVHVGAERDVDESTWVLSVRDDGIGIDPEDRERIFELFDRLHTSDEHVGTGIGLALCQRIVERHGGEIWVDSEPGEGSTFFFTLPPVEGSSAGSADRPTVGNGPPHA